MEELRAKKPAAKDYLWKIDSLLWTAEFFPENPRRFVHNTSKTFE